MLSFTTDKSEMQIITETTWDTSLPMRILLVEDNLDLCASLSDYLESHLAVVDCAYNGNAGLELARQQEFDAIILDINLPGLNGIQLCQKLRQDLQLPRS